jgi:hypothetical protein
MDDTDSTPEVESAGEVAPEADATPEPELDNITVDSVLEDAIEEHYEEETPSSPGRDEKGRFASNNPEGVEPDGDPDEAPPEEASGEGEDGEDTEAEADSEQVKESPLDPPDHWPDADKANFNSMPRNAQEWALERYKSMTADYTRKTQEAAQIRQHYEPINQVLEPIRNTLQQRGVSESDYVGRLVEADRLLQTDPVGTIQWLAQQAGVDLATLEPGESNYADPQIAALQNRVDQLTNHVSEQERQTAETRTTELGGQIESFSKKADSDGNLLHPHFDTVRHVMGSLIQAGQAQTMDDAYAKAIRLDDGLYRQTLAAERTKVESVEDNRRQEAVAKAKKVQPKKSSRPTRGTTRSDNLDDLLGSSIDAAGIV